MRKKPQGQAKNETGRELQRKIDQSVEDGQLLLFQLSLAHRRLQDIMSQHDLASVVWWRELTFVDSIVHSAHGIVKGFIHGAIAASSFPEGSPPEASLGEAGELRCSHCGRSERDVQRGPAGSISDTARSEDTRHHDHEDSRAVAPARHRRPE